MLQLSISYQQLPVPIEEWKQKAIVWANQHHEAVAYYSSNNIDYRHGAFKNLLGVRKCCQGSNSVIASTWQELKNLQESTVTPLLGFLTYDLKNSLENLTSQHPDNIGFPELAFFAPEAYIHFEEETLTVYSEVDSPDSIIQAISSTTFSSSFPKNSLKTVARISREEYIQSVQKLQQHIVEGDVYEINFCQEFYAEQASLDPVQVYFKLNEISPTPFSGFLKWHDKYLLCASPERFLKKENDLLISQPIKGTIRRGSTPEEDLANKATLASSEKERAENMMIVDLVRNDLNRVAAIGTVKVEEFFGLYGFQHVWQMISTITGKLSPEADAVQALQAAFPMGSMTGAPKIKALELIEKYEKTKRGLYSGSFGYFLPNGDFDFNVVIRSIQYNAATRYLNYEVGSAITYDSVPEQEYEECLLKAFAIKSVLEKH
ncbi:aminodeoxychorismate synthase component I [Rufibacter roseus]|uniref:Aminodeoxychorismate synthase component I n=1 Tax=Rufibacter roseus TaxID=1567108 RepID=A0ABW2DP58_9BACT|nr:aminodeoxychorismate synthase component I [Rufibacter roseus]